MTRRHLLTAVVFAATAVFAGGVASAEISKKVIAEFKGQIVITKGELPEASTDKETIAKIKAARVTTVQGQDNGETKQWSFHYAAFLTKTGASDLKLQFWRDGKKYAADKGLSGVDPKSGVLTGEVTIDEDEGLVAGGSYVVKLAAGNTVVATTNLVTK